MKIGLFAIITISTLIGLCACFNGTNSSNQSIKVYVEYEAVDGLNISSPIFVNGFKVGVVYDLYLKSDNSRKVMVVLKLTEKINIPKNGTFAAIKSSSLMGGKQINLLFPSGGCQANDCLQNGDTIAGGTQGMFAALQTPNGLLPKVEKTLETVDTVVEQLTKNWKAKGKKIATSSSAQLDAIVTNLNATTQELKTLTQTINNKMDGIQNNMNQLTSGLKGKDSQVQKTLKNITNFNHQLKSANFKKTQSSANEVAEDLKKTVDNLNTTISELESTLKKIDDSTIGKFLGENGPLNRIDSASLNYLKQRFGN